VKRKKIVIIGGGTGTYSILLGLKKYPVNLSVIITMMDSGGSNRVIRDEFGLLPTSDIRQAIVALSSENTDDVLRKLFTYRYTKGVGIEGMTFGNLFMAALTDIYGTQEKAIEKTKELLDVEGDIIPITYDDAHLIARYSNGRQVLGEHQIDQPCKENLGHRIVELEVVPQATINPKAVKAIKEADLVVFGPGDLYTSVLSNLVIGGVAEALRKTKAKKVFVLNLMTRHGQTDNYTARDHIKEVERYVGDGVIDVCIINKSKSFPKGVLVRYRQENAHPVEDDLDGGGIKKVIRGDFISKVVYEKSKSDKLTRSLIRHDPEKLARAVISLLHT